LTAALSPETADTLSFFGYFAAALAYAAVSVLMMTSWRRGPLGAWLIAACLLTAVWSAAEAVRAIEPGVAGGIISPLELARSAGWIAFLIAVLIPTWEGGIAARMRLAVPATVALLCISIALIDIFAHGWVGVQLGSITVDIGLFGRLILALIGLLLVENLFTNTAPHRRWSIKYLSFGVAALFAFDFFMYSEAALFQRLNEGLVEARGLVNAVVVPLIAVSATRNPSWSLDLFVSRRFIFRSATLIGAGCYLLMMAGAGFYLRQFGGEWGAAVQATFIFAAAVGLVVVSTSGTVRSRLKVTINKHFFNYKYDYREEWLRLISTISSEDSVGALPDRVIEAIANIVDSPEGALWRRRDGDRFDLLATWNCRARDGILRVHPEFSELVEQRPWVIDLADLRRRPEQYQQFNLPDWIEEIPRSWLLIPLMHLDRLTGLLVLGRPRAPQELNWEDYDLLKTAGRQAASYLEEHSAARALTQSQQFDKFNRRFAFVIHDIKNLASQLSLMLENAKKHKANPAFQEDMLETIHESVEKMKRLLVRLNEDDEARSVRDHIELDSFLAGVVRRSAVSPCRLTYESPDRKIEVSADEERLGAVFAHLIDNAFEAAGPEGTVRIDLAVGNGEAVIEVIDDGPGMDPQFVNNDLFRPFRSTKSEGYGIGAFECREYVRDMGGILEVESKLGAGTTVRITFPTVSVSHPSELAEVSMLAQ
jgi:putative PEP-CTERM system histidine kinase